ncbi:hypothetical protein E2C01_044621 [Portunus trituberculatus]|uniref:Uncharacterized protein n=1 Tax=Portunus trituberculatus TaxID=210409 RepID=A0A5B7FZN6_PORTR|nr:hypothetical protein [Portunus trituberculatus]
MRNVRPHARYYHLCYTFSTKGWASDTEAVIIPGKISIIPPQVPQAGKGKTLWGILWRAWRYRTRYRNEIVIGGAQRR